MTENQRHKYQKFKSKHKAISVDKNEGTNTAVENANARKKLGFVDLKDFPELRTCGGNHDNVTHSQSNNGKVLNNKSWLSVVSKGNAKNFKQAFPTLPTLESTKKNGDDIVSKKDNGKSQPFVGNGEIVVEKAVAPKDKKVQNPVVNQENKSVSSLKIIVQPQRNPHKKKRSDPIFFNFQDVLTAHKPLKKPKQRHIFKNRQQQHRNKEILSGNCLDSSNPVRSRGKHREIKKKKLTKLKLAIIKERIIKQKMKEKGIGAYSAGAECFNFIENTDFKVEIKKYLDELNEKKRKKTESLHRPLKESLNSKTGNEQTEEINTNEAVNEKENSENTVLEITDKKISKNSSGSSSYRGKIKFTSKFREYCDNILTPGLNTAVSELIADLVNLQDRQFAWDPIKAKKKKRHVSGLREVKKYLTLKRVKLIIIAPNLEKLQMEGGVYDSINELKSMANDQNVPYGFALNRYKLGRCTKKNVPVSAFAVLNYEGIEELFENALHHLNTAKESFLELTRLNTKKVEGDIEEEDVNARVISSLISAFREELKLPNENAQSNLE